MPLSNLVPVSFRVTAPVRYGETLYVVGDVPALGSGNFSYGVPLVTTPESFPEWFTQSPIPLAKGQSVQYKYAIFSGGNFSRWEDREESRVLQVTEGQTVEDSVKVDELFTTQKAQTKQMPFKKASRGSNESAQQAFRDRKKMMGIDDDDGVIVVTYFLPVKIVKLAGDGSESETESRGADLENKGAPEKDSEDPAQTSSKLNQIAKGTSLRTWSSSSSAESKVQWKIEWDESALLSRKKSSIADHMRVLYIGVPNYTGHILPSEQESLASALVRFRCVPVFIKPDVRDLHYHVYCYDTLRKLFHHQVDVYAPLPTRWWNGPMHVASWLAYRTVNQNFAEKVVEVYNEGDIIWIHGYELLLLPSLLKRRLQAGNPHIGLFIHSPFPSSEIFRTLSVRDDILRGMLNADQIGFHLYEYARPFLSCCHRILGIQHHGHENDSRGLLTVDYQGRRVYITVCHAGIEPELVRSTLRSSKVFGKARAILSAAIVKTVESTQPAAAPQLPDEAFKALLEKTKDQCIVVGIDAMEYLRGVHYKLVAFESFLNKYPEWADNICLIQVYLKVERDTEESVEVRSLARRISKRINENFPRPAGRRPAVCLLEWSSCTFADRLALFSIADTFWNTPLRSGLDLPVFEFTIVADERKKVPEAPWAFNLQPPLDPRIADVRLDPALVLSEFTAAFRVLPASIRCNPWREAEMIETLELALTMDKEERSVRKATALNYVNEHVESNWAQLVLSDIKNSRPAATDKKLDGLTPAGLGFGLQFRAIEFRPNFRHLSDEVIIDAYRTSFQRLIILDYGGTTVSDEYVPQDASNPLGRPQPPPTSKFEFRYRPQGEAIVPQPSMIRSLQTLVADPRNTVFIVSGRERQELEAAFEDVPGIGLTAEHGCFYSWGNKTTWSRLVSSSEGEDPEAADTVEDLPTPPHLGSPQSLPMNSAGTRTITPPLVAAPDVTTMPEPGTILSRRRSRSSSMGSHENTFCRRSSFRAQTEAETVSGNRKLHDGLLRSWVTLSDHFDDSWMDLSEQIMDVYTQRTNGTYIERKGSSIVWQYRDAEPEFGNLQAAELQDHLHGVLKAFPIEVVSGKGYVEVCPQGVDKGNACAHILGMLWPNDTLPDFVLCIGDDIADEAMFEFFLQLYADLREDRSRSVSLSEATSSLGAPLQLESSILSRSTSQRFTLGEKSMPPVQQEVPSSSKLFTCVVGEKPSVAQYYVNDVDEVGEVLSVLAKVSTKLEVSKSYSDIRRAEMTRSPSEVLRRTFDGYQSVVDAGDNLDNERGPFSEESKDPSTPDAPAFSNFVPPMMSIASAAMSSPMSLVGAMHHHPHNGSAVSLSDSINYASSISDADTQDGHSTEEQDAIALATTVALAAKNHQSFLDLRVLDLQRKKNPIASASMPALSEYFSLDVSQPTSTTAQEYLDLIADDEDSGIMF